MPMDSLPGRNTTGGYVVLGDTSNLGSSVVLIRRYKTVEDLRDIFTGDDSVARRALKHREKGIFVFEECRRDEDCLFLISFDIKSVRTRRGTKSGSTTRKPSHEYSEIMDMLYTNLCGSVDLSTYICADDVSGDVDRYLGEVSTSYHIVRLYVRPWRDEDRELVMEAVQETLGRVLARALAMASRVSNSRQGYGQLRKKATEFLEALSVAREVARKLEEKLRKMGIEVSAVQVVSDAEGYVREAIQRREELRERLKELRRRRRREVVHGRG